MLIYNIYQRFLTFGSTLIFRYPLSKITHSSVLPYTRCRNYNIINKANTSCDN